MFDNWLQGLAFGVVVTFFTGLLAVIVAGANLKSMDSKKTKA